MAHISDMAEARISFPPLFPSSLKHMRDSNNYSLTDGIGENEKVPGRILLEQIWSAPSYGNDFINIMMLIMVEKLVSYGNTLNALKIGLDKKAAESNKLNELVGKLNGMDNGSTNTDVSEITDPDVVEQLKRMGKTIIERKGKVDGKDVPANTIIKSNGKYWTTKANFTSWIGAAQSRITNLQNLTNLDSASMQQSTSAFNAFMELTSNVIKKIADSVSTVIGNTR
ncbi:MAG: hypothetical protein PW790_11120 [Parvibaculaceae bacterium]|nr:hypothetical protein [Parvibaculaceae bacterium]